MGRSRSAAPTGRADASLTSGRGRKREKAAACAATLALRRASFADGYYPIGLTNSGNGDDSSLDDCNSGRGNNIGDVHAC